MIRASRRKLPSAEPLKAVISPWLLLILLVAAAAICWSLYSTVAAIIFTAFAALITAGIVTAPFTRRRHEEKLAKLPPSTSCSYARSFDFRHTETLAMRAVFEELQPLVEFPIRASHRLVEDLRLDGEDLNLDFAPIIAQRLRRTLDGSEKNPYYGRVHTVEDLVRFMEAQPSDGVAKT
jgi:hypothetical protein